MFYILSKYINLLCERNTQKMFNFINIKKNSLWKCQESRIGYSCYKINTSPLKYHT